MSSGSTDDTTLLEWVGLVLLFVGVVLALFVVKELFAVYSNPESHHFVAYLTDKLSGAEVASAEETTTIGDGGATLSAYVIFGFLAWVAVSIASTLIRVGYDLATKTIEKKLAAVKAAYDARKGSSGGGAA